MEEQNDYKLAHANSAGASLLIVLFEYLNVILQIASFIYLIGELFYHNAPLLYVLA